MQPAGFLAMKISIINWGLLRRASFASTFLSSSLTCPARQSVSNALIASVPSLPTGFGVRTDAIIAFQNTNQLSFYRVSTLP